VNLEVNEMNILPGVLKGMLVPPMILLLLAIVGLMAPGRWAKTGRRVALASLLGVYALGTPVVGNILLQTMQEENAVETDGQAIVILSAGIVSDAPEYFGTTADALTLERLRYGAKLKRSTGLPVLVTGGTLKSDVEPAADVMTEILKTEYGIRPDWTERLSTTTAENARLSAPLLQAARIKRIYLVTHAWHMTRARLAFERQGLTVYAAGTGYCPKRPIVATDFLPSMKSLMESYCALHEAIGTAVYHVLA
jgi:uncharacterized SAM-binding protein YcdF (DUF218 family)